jgi:thioredoxin reductase
VDCERNGFEPFDVAIIGGGPAGLSAASMLGRCRRRTVVYDFGRPRNWATGGAHGYLGLEGTSPQVLLERGQLEARKYGVEIAKSQVQSIHCNSLEEQPRHFSIYADDGNVATRAVLLATGVKDQLPPIMGFAEYFGRSVHHCPYCDGWEHRDQRLVAFGEKSSAVPFAVSLLRWSSDVTHCSNGRLLGVDERRMLARNGVTLEEDRIIELKGRDGILQSVLFSSGRSLECDAIFYNHHAHSISALVSDLGCRLNEEGFIHTDKSHGTSVAGVFAAGDLDGEVQMAIVAAAEGLVAAMEINQFLQHEEDEQRGRESAAISLARSPL